MPAPPKSSKIADSESEPESNPNSGYKDPRFGIPDGIRKDGVTVLEPRIVLRHIHQFGSGWFNDNGVALSHHLLLFIAIQVAVLVSLLTQCLDGVCHILLLVGVCVAKR